MPRTVIISKFTSAILDFQKSEGLPTEDFLSIMKPSEITKVYQKLDRNKSSRYDNKLNLLLMYYILEVIIP